MREGRPQSEAVLVVVLRYRFLVLLHLLADQLILKRRHPAQSAFVALCILARMDLSRPSHRLQLSMISLVLLLHTDEVKEKPLFLVDELPIYSLLQLLHIAIVLTVIPLLA